MITHGELARGGLQKVCFLVEPVTDGARHVQSDESEDFAAEFRAKRDGHDEQRACT